MCARVCACACVLVTFSGDTDHVDVVAHCGAGGAKLFAEDHGLDPNLEAVKMI